MSQISPDPIETTSDVATNGEARSASRALMVRDYEAQALSQYVMPTGMPAYAEPGAGGVNLMQLLHSLRRRWLLALCAGLMVGVPLAGLVWLITPENYEVSAWLQVGDPPEQALDSHGRARNATEFEQFRKTQAALIESPKVLGLALNEIANLPMLADEKQPVEFLEEEISVVFPMDSEVLQITMRGQDKTQLVKIVNAVKDSYLKNIVAETRKTSLKTYDLVDKELKENHAEISQKRSQLVQLAQQINAPDFPTAKANSQLLMNEAMRVSQRLSEAITELGGITAFIAVLEEKEKNGYVPDEFMIESVMSRDPVVSQYTSQLTYYNQALGLQRQAVKFPDRDRSVRRLQDQIVEIELQLGDYRNMKRPQVEQYLQGEQFSDLGGPGEVADLETMKIKEAQMTETVKLLREEYKASAKKAAEASMVSADLMNLEADLERQENNTANLEARLQQLTLQIQLPSRVTELQPAWEPEGTNPLVRYFLTAFAGLVGLALGSGAVVALEYQARRVNTTSELAPGAGLRVLGTVPNVAKLSHAKGLNGSAALYGILAESVDSIRTMLLQQSREDAPHALIVTSAGDREGKTTVATHLAASLARSGRRTLLIDGDLRSPSVHAMFNVAGEPGVCEVLRGEADFEGVLQPTPVDNLMFIAAGQCDYQCIAALAKEDFKALLEKAREQFEYIVIDAAPVLTYADTLLMGAHVDAAVLSVRRDVSQMQRVYEARERMESVDIHILGAVVNGITETSRRPAYALPSSA